MFRGKTFLLTGATHGIGLKIANDLAQKEAQLILISRNGGELEKLIYNLDAVELGHSYYVVDVSDPAGIRNIFLEIESDIPELDGIINCAGIFGKIGKLEDVSPVEFQESINTNLIGVYNTSYYGLNLLNKPERGKIINFSGGGDTDVFPNYSSYACSKIALVKLTENLASEYPDLDINIVAPGFIKTRLAAKTIEAGEKAGKFYGKTVEMIKTGGVDVVYTIDLISFLLSNNSNGISGKLISAPWDNWKSEFFQEKLRTNKDFCSLRRIDDKYFKSKQTFT